MGIGAPIRVLLIVLGITQFTQFRVTWSHMVSESTQLSHIGQC